MQLRYVFAVMAFNAIARSLPQGSLPPDPACFPPTVNSLCPEHSHVSCCKRTPGQLSDPVTGIECFSVDTTGRLEKNPVCEEGWWGCCPIDRSPLAFSLLAPPILLQNETCTQPSGPIPYPGGQCFNDRCTGALFPVHDIPDPTISPRV
ncbi:hypothetical protein Tdes44962_MAKER03212 [Teratosphaeria destructans]|uniref:Uncharacterized protein n=1 Tax=Teratosphaeria destructans TaxID=418781 RepID=A0A9W7SQM5_9PEZI|nr:hypothetical protein Tdes44962_MAKER03212 [Teratosphaeria destructans]